ncbi:MAG: hypothetical protein HW403_593 [Dehalococcoidia bacterium]|nr:hypothetical protein [Dehalococcoidia bacterium]
MDSLTNLYATITELLATYNYPLLLGLLFIEEAGIPLPISGDVLLMIIGYYISKGQISPTFSLLSIEIASLVGASIPYLLGRQGGHAIILRFGKYVHINPSRVATIERWLQHHSGLAIIIGRLIPGGRVVTSLLSGTFEIPYRDFLIYTGVGSLIWAASFLALGYMAGRELDGLKKLLQVHPAVSIAVFAILIVVMLFAIYLFLFRKRLRKEGKIE